MYGFLPLPGSAHKAANVAIYAGGQEPAGTETRVSAEHAGKSTSDRENLTQTAHRGTENQI